MEKDRERDGSRLCDEEFSTALEVRQAGNAPLPDAVMDNPRKIVKSISTINDKATASLTRFNDHTEWPWTSFQAPMAARPENATSPMTALYSIPVSRGQCLRRTAKMTKVKPSEKYVNEERVRKRRMEPRRGMRFATTTEVMGDDDDDEEVEDEMKGKDNVARSRMAGERILRTKTRMSWGGRRIPTASTASIVVVLVVAAECSGDGENKRGKQRCANSYVVSRGRMQICRPLVRLWYCDRVESNILINLQMRRILSCSKLFQAACTTLIQRCTPHSRASCNLLQCTSDQQVPQVLWGRRPVLI